MTEIDTAAGSAGRSPSTLKFAIEAIRRYIVDNRLEPGSPLPPETVLSTRLGISRNILREAMRHYRTLGIIASKPRVGAVIRQLIPEDAYAGYRPFMSTGKRLLRELVESRICLEVGSAEFVAAAARDEDIAVLEEIIDRQKRAVDRQGTWNCDIAFHSAILRIPDNRILNSQLPLLVEFFQSVWLQSGRIRPQSAGHTIENHRAMVEAIRTRNGRLLGELLRQHSNSYLDFARAMDEKTDAGSAHEGAPEWLER